MSRKELDRVAVIRGVVEKRLKQSRAARQLGITARQIRRLVKRYGSEREAGLISFRRGQLGNHRIAHPQNFVRWNSFVNTTATLAPRWPVKNL